MSRSRIDKHHAIPISARSPMVASGRQTAVSLQVLDQWPRGLEQLSAQQLYKRLAGPTLIHLQGVQGPPLFLTALLHGDEPVGWDAARNLLAAYAFRPPRPVSLFIGNIAAARRNVRRLDDQQDFNRIWRNVTGYEAQIVQQVLAEAERVGFYASVDMHNNSGTNPYYSCVTKLDADTLLLAQGFSPLTVYTRQPVTIQCAAFARLGPAITLEAGQAGDEQGMRQVRDFLQQLLENGLTQLPCPKPLLLFHTVARVEIEPGWDFGFSGGEQLELLPDLAAKNFRELPAGCLFARARDMTAFRVLDDQGRNVRDRYFFAQDGEIRLRNQSIFSMFTQNIKSIQQDCLCYLMEHNVSPEP